MSKKMSRYPTDRKVYVGDLGNSARKNDLEYAFSAYGALRSVWIARNPPGFAFVEFEDARDAADAVRGLDGRTVCGRRARVELSTGKFAGSSGRGDRRGADRSRGGRNFNSDDKCYECGGRGHYARDCRRHGRNRRRSNSRSRSRSGSRGQRSRSRSRSRSATRSHSRQRSLSTIKDVTRTKRTDTHNSKSKENGRSENGDSSRYSDDERNGGGGASPPLKRRYDDSSPSPKRTLTQSKRGRSHSRRRGNSTLSRSRSSSRRD